MKAWRTQENYDSPRNRETKSIKVPRGEREPEGKKGLKLKNLGIDGPWE
jgi:hypothetical protein